MIGFTKTFAGFDVGNPQHLVWLKRKLARKARYERARSRRQATPGMYKCGLPRHQQSRPPAAQLLTPRGRDTDTLMWQQKAREIGRIPHPQYARHPITRRII